MARSYFAVGTLGTRALDIFAIRAIELPDKGYARHYQHLKAARLPVAPISEQQRIADKLDTTLARVEACRERLGRVESVLKRFRQAVLNAALSGELTSAANAGYPISLLASLVGKPLRNGESVKDGLGLRVLRLSALRKGRIDLTESKPGLWENIDASRFLVVNGDFLVAKGNGSKELVGRGGLIKECAVLSKAFRGELVPQDPADEPAAELLKRLQAQKAAAPVKKGRKGRDSSNSGIGDGQAALLGF